MAFPNRYPGPCARCGATIPAGGGDCEKVSGRWTVSHRGECSSASATAKPAAAGRGKCACGDPLNEWEVRHGVRRCAECRDGGSRARGGMSYRDRNGNFVLGEDD